MKDLSELFLVKLKQAREGSIYSQQAISQKDDGLCFSKMVKVKMKRLEWGSPFKGIIMKRAEHYLSQIYFPKSILASVHIYFFFVSYIVYTKVWVRFPPRSSPDLIWTTKIFLNIRFQKLHRTFRENLHLERETRLFPSPRQLKKKDHGLHSL